MEVDGSGGRDRFYRALGGPLNRHRARYSRPAPEACGDGRGHRRLACGPLSRGRSESLASAGESLPDLRGILHGRTCGGHIQGALVDYWTITMGPVRQILDRAPDVLPAVAAGVPTPGQLAPVAFIGVGDFLFMAMFLSAAEKLSMDPRRSAIFFFVLVSLAQRGSTRAGGDRAGICGRQCALLSSLAARDCDNQRPDCRCGSGRPVYELAWERGELRRSWVPRIPEARNQV